MSKDSWIPTTVNTRSERSESWKRCEARTMRLFLQSSVPCGIPRSPWLRKVTAPWIERVSSSTNHAEAEYQLQHGRASTRAQASCESTVFSRCKLVAVSDFYNFLTLLSCLLWVLHLTSQTQAFKIWKDLRNYSEWKLHSQMEVHVKEGEKIVNLTISLYHPR